MIYSKYGINTKKDKGVKVLSCFDGISCARAALKRAGIEIDRYYASEVDKYAIKIAQKNYHHTVQIGDIKEIDCTGGKLHFGMGKLAETDIDLVIGGSPCQDLSIAKKDRKGLDGERSGLFWEYVRILKQLKPKYFILENVASMPKESKDVISKTLGVEPTMINAALVSAQNRKRLFWVGKLVGDTYVKVDVSLPEDRGILLKDILEQEVDEKYLTKMDFTKRFDYTIHQKPFDKKGQALRATDYKGTHNMIRIGHLKQGGQGDRIYSPNGKSVGLSALGGGRGAKTGPYIIQTPRGKNKGGIRAKNGKTPTLSSSSWEHNNKLTDGSTIRRLTPIECERLQSLPDNYTAGVSDSQRYKMLGNAFNVDVVAHILSNLRLK